MTGAAGEDEEALPLRPHSLLLLESPTAFFYYTG
jgi:hypothetical protein